MIRVVFAMSCFDVQGEAVVAVTASRCVGTEYTGGEFPVSINPISLCLRRTKHELGMCSPQKCPLTRMVTLSEVQERKAGAASFWVTMRQRSAQNVYESSVDDNT